MRDSNAKDELGDLSEETPLLDEMPMLGLGTWQNTDRERCIESVQTALENGYRHVDTAHVYGNEEAVGEGIARADVDRSEVFLATKVWIDHLAYEDAIEAAEESLDRLGVDYVDLLYVHWPSRTYDPEETMAAFDRLLEDGVTKRIGVSNFEHHHLETACDEAENRIFANQIEIHPHLPQTDLVEACKRRNVHVVAYSPLARGAVFDTPELADVAEKYGVSEAQVALAWLRERGIAAIPKASTEDHIRDNVRSLGLDLDQADMERIDEIDRIGRQLDPDFAPWN